MIKFARGNLNSRKVRRSRLRIKIPPAGNTDVTNGPVKVLMTHAKLVRTTEISGESVPIPSFGEQVPKS
jgi:hypothetical protein